MRCSGPTPKAAGPRREHKMQVGRLFEITYMLLEHGTVTARALAERFEVSPRTIYRDVEHLSAAGIPVYMEKGRNGGICLLPEFVLDKAVLTAGEKRDILSALGGLAATGFREADGALKKLAALFGDNGSRWIEVDFSGWGWGREAKERFDRLKDAILNRRAVEFTYYGSGAGRAGGGTASGGTKTSGGTMTSRSAEPSKLVFRGQSWYLYAWCRLRGDYRFFKLSRMADIRLSDEIFERRGPLPEPDADGGQPPSETVSVVFRADAVVAFRIYDEYPHDAIHPQEDGSLIVRTEMPQGEWLAGYFLTYGQHLEILEPASLRAELRDILRGALSIYD